MKRSAMLELIREKMEFTEETLQGLSLGEIHNYKNILADSILTIIEKAEMLPPFHPFEREWKGDWGLPVNKWDDE